ncbi:MAG: hypothetical protein ACTSRC_17865 [Candidatus Helarchaeota archaeon]
MSYTKVRSKSCGILFVLFFSVYMSICAVNSFASTGYFDIIIRDKNVMLDWNSQMGKTYLIIYENLVLGVTVVEDEGPLQGYFQIDINYENSGGGKQTALTFKLEHLNFFIDMDDDLCQTWSAQFIGSNLILTEIDEIISAIAPISTWDWILAHPEYLRHSGIEDFKFIPFFENFTESGSELVWGIEETVKYALKYEDIVYWDYYITLKFRILFHFQLRGSTAYLEYEAQVENCSISEWFEYYHGFSSLNLAFEWTAELSVTRGMQTSPTSVTMDDNEEFEYETALYINNCEFLGNGEMVGQINLGTTFLEDDNAIQQLYTSAIYIRQYENNQGNLDTSYLRYSQTIPDYEGEKISVSSQMELYFATNTVNIIFILLFNVIFSIILMRKGIKAKKEEIA